MAEKAAHVSSTTNPAASIFDVFAAESLQTTLHPALKPFFRYFTSFNNLILQKISDYYDEVYFIAHGIIQRHYLNSHNATFSEQVYGLKRVDTNKENEVDKKARMYFLIFLFPYLRIKTEEIRRKYRLQLSDGDIKNSYEKIIKSSTSFLIEISEVMWRLWSVVQSVRYMSGKSMYQTPELMIQHQQLVYDTSNTQEQTSFELLAFLFQFVSSWRADQHVMNKEHLPKPPPPPYDRNSSRLRGKCGICLQSWVVPTVLRVSGYVFCFRCIIQHFQTESCCPITKLPTNVQNIMRIYTT